MKNLVYLLLGMGMAVMVYNIFSLDDWRKKFLNHKISLFPVMAIICLVIIGGTAIFGLFVDDCEFFAAIIGMIVTLCIFSLTDNGLLESQSAWGAVLPIKNMLMCQFVGFFIFSLPLIVFYDSLFAKVLCVLTDTGIAVAMKFLYQRETKRYNDWQKEAVL